MCQMDWLSPALNDGEPPEIDAQDWSIVTEETRRQHPELDGDTDSILDHLRTQQETDTGPAIVGLVSAIAQSVDFGTKIVERLQDFHPSVNEVPKAFRDVKVELPLLLHTLKRTQAQAESGALSRETQEALLPVVEGYRSQVELLDSTLVKTLPKLGNSS